MTKFDSLQLGDVVIPSSGQYRGTFVVITETKYKDTNEVSGIALTNKGVLYFKDELEYPTKLEQKAFDTLLIMLDPSIVLANTFSEDKFFLFDTRFGKQQALSKELVSTIFKKIPLRQCSDMGSVGGKPTILYILPDSIRVQLQTHLTLINKRGN